MKSNIDIKKICINDNWKYHRGDISSPNISWDYIKVGVRQDSGAHIILDDSEWKTVNLPHDYVVESSFINIKDTKFGQNKAVTMKNVVDIDTIMIYLMPMEIT